MDYNMVKLTMKTPRRSLALFCFTLVLTFAVGCRSTQPGKVVHPTSLDVRSFLAKGDGVTKDTAAFQAAP